MSDRTSINVDKDSHTEASDVKDEYGETWPEVLQWYAEHRPQDADTAESVELANAEQLAGFIIQRLNKSDTEDINKSVMEQLDRIESGVKEATNAAQSADRKLEDLGR